MLKPNFEKADGLGIRRTNSKKALGRVRYTNNSLPGYFGIMATR